MPNNGLRDWLPYGYPGSELPGAEYDTPEEAGERAAAQKRADDALRFTVVSSYAASPEITGKPLPPVVDKFKAMPTWMIGVAIVAILIIVLIVRR